MYIDPGLSEWVERLKENKRWDRLIDAILAGDVIPVVGSDFLVETDDGGIASFPDHHKQLIDVWLRFANCAAMLPTFRN